MIESSKKKNKVQMTTTVLLAATILSLLLLAFRIVYAGYSTYIFLAWNLCLAWAPLLFGDLALFFRELNKSYRFWILLFLWFIFFPNAPYILTDFIHLKPWAFHALPVWFDALLIGSFSFTGLVLGFCSLQTVQRIFAKKLSTLWNWVLMVGILFLSGFGIYIGRYLRWNSWDIIMNPIELFQDIALQITHPRYFFETWTYSFLFGISLTVGYFIFWLVFRYEPRMSFNEGGTSVKEPG